MPCGERPCQTFRLISMARRRHTQLKYRGRGIWEQATIDRWLAQFWRWVGIIALAYLAYILIRIN